MIKKIISLANGIKSLDMNKNNDFFRSILKNIEYPDYCLKIEEEANQMRSFLEVKRDEECLKVPNYLANDIMRNFDPLVKEWVELAPRGEFPVTFRSPITFDLLVSPYINIYGQTDNKDQLEFLKKSTNPIDVMTRAPLKGTCLYFNSHIIHLIYKCFFKVIDHFNENKQVDVSRSMLKIWATELLKIDVNQEINGQKMIAHMLKYRLSLKKK